MVLTRALNQAARITSIKTIGIVQLSAISANKPQTITLLKLQFISVLQDREKERMVYASVRLRLMET